VSTLLHDVTTLAEYTGTDCKQSGKLRKLSSKGRDYRTVSQQQLFMLALQFFFRGILTIKAVVRII
jgi:hypothetical protein